MKRVIGLAGRVVWLLLIGVGSLQAAQVAPAVSSQARPVTTLGAVVVSGSQPGPGLWRVSKPGHVLWILGTTSPLPRQIQWQSQDVALALAHSQALLDPPALDIKIDTGFFGKLWLLPALIGVRNNPDDKRLQEVVSADAYARWKILKARYIGDSDKVEHWRPIFAAYELYHQAMKQHGLDRSGGVLAEVRRLAALKQLPRVSTTTVVTIEQPRKLVSAFKHSQLDDAQCFEQTLTNLDSDMQSFTQRANAWAMGDISALRGLYQHNEKVTCLDVLNDAGFLKQQGLGDLPARQQDGWLHATISALQAHAQIFATVPMDLLLVGQPNYLTDLQAAGYQVEAPDADDAPSPATADSASAPATSGSAHW